MIHIAIVDDHAVVRAGLRQFFSEQPDFEVVAEAASGAAAVAIARQAGIDIVLLDISMPGQSGVDALVAIKARAPGLPVLILSGFPEAYYATTLLRLGASGYLNKACNPVDIVTAVRTVCRGRRYISEAVAEQLANNLDRVDRPAHENLSERELQIFLRLARGEYVGKMATSLALSPKTISTYRARVLAKLGLGSNSELTRYALQAGLIH